MTYSILNHKYTGTLPTVEKVGHLVLTVIKNFTTFLNMKLEQLFYCYKL